jgi:hypothetical protein
MIRLMKEHAQQAHCLSILGFTRQYLLIQCRGRRQVARLVQSESGPKKFLHGARP